MKTFECYTRGSAIIEAETEQQAREIFAEMVMGEPTDEIIAAIEVDPEENE